MRKKETLYREIAYIIIGLAIVLLYLYGAGILVSWILGGIFNIQVEWYFGTSLYILFGNITDLAKV